MQVIYQPYDCQVSLSVIYLLILLVVFWIAEVLNLMKLSIINHVFHLMSKKSLSKLRLQIFSPMSSNSLRFYIWTSINLFILIEEILSLYFFCLIAYMWISNGSSTIYCRNYCLFTELKLTPMWKISYSKLWRSISGLSMLLYLSICIFFYWDHMLWITVILKTDDVSPPNLFFFFKSIELTDYSII